MRFMSVEQFCQGIRFEAEMLIMEIEERLEAKMAFGSEPDRSAPRQRRMTAAEADRRPRLLQVPGGLALTERWMDAVASRRGLRREVTDVEEEAWRRR